MGYAPEGWDGLKSIFPDYESLTLVESGLVIERTDEEGGNRKRYDRFRDRIMFPIRNTKGQVIGFGGRVLDKGEPKYLNSPETPLFQKGSELYGLFEARQAIRDAGYALVTEGYMDVVALAQLGFPQAVATLGTACTATHVHKLLRQTDHVIFSFDGDNAGRRAARRALEACLPYATDDKMIQFLFLPKEHDPDSFIRERGYEAFEKEVRDAMPLSEFLLKEVCGEHSLQTPEGRAHIQHDAKPMLQAMPATSLRLQIVRGLSQLTQSTPAEIEGLFELVQPVARARVAPPRGKRSAPVGLELQIMRILVAHPSLALQIEDDAAEALLESAEGNAEMLGHLIGTCQAMGENANFAALAEHLRNNSGAVGADYEAIIAEIASAPESDIDLVRIELAGAIRQTRMKILKAETNRIAEQGMGSPEALQRYRDLNQQIEALRRQAETEAAQR
jgi:DNA primase